MRPRDDDLAAQPVVPVPLCCGVLIGGSSTRMGRPKHLLRHGAETLLERTLGIVASRLQQVVLLGEGELPAACRSLPRLLDAAPSLGPLGGMLAAHRSAPDHAWLFCPCDLPDLSAAAIDWLLSQRQPGRWAVVPRTAGGLEPLLAIYEPQALALLERLAAAGKRAPRLIAPHAKIAEPSVPASLASSWRGVNSPADLARLAERART